MDNKVEKVNYANQLLIAITVAIVTAVLGILVQYISSSFEHAKIIVNKSINTNNEFYTNVCIKNYKTDSALNELNICISNEIDIIRLISQYEYTIKNNVINVNNVQPLEALSIIIITDEMIKVNDVKLDSKYSVDIDFIENYKSVSVVIIVSIIISTVFYGALFFLSNVFSEKRRIKQDLQYEKDNKRMQDLFDMSMKQIDNLTKQSHENEIKHRRYRFYYMKRTFDLSSELKFWRDTISKLLYIGKSGNISSDVIFKTVTTSLKTFTANEKTIKEIDEIFSIAKELEDEKANLTPGIEES